jgi:hypothetical protein
MDGAKKSLVSIRFHGPEKTWNLVQSVGPLDPLRGQGGTVAGILLVADILSICR